MYFTVEYCGHAWLDSAPLREDDKRANKNMTMASPWQHLFLAPGSVLTQLITIFDADSWSAHKDIVRSESTMLQDLQTHGKLANSVGNYRTIGFLVGGNGDFAEN